MDRLTSLASAWPFEFRWLELAVQVADLRPLALWLVLVPLLVGLSRRSLVPLSPAARRTSLALRALLLGCLLAALSGVRLETESSRLCLGVALDVSASVAEDDLTATLEVLRALEQARSDDDSLVAVAFAERALQAYTSASSSTVSSGSDRSGPLLKLAELRERAREGATDVAAGLELTSASLGSNCTRRILLATDGRATRGNAAAWLADARGSAPTAPADFVWLRFESDVRPDVAVVAVEPPATVRTHEPFRYQVRLVTSGASEGVLRVHQSDRPNAPLLRDVSLPVGETTLSFEGTTEQEGSLELEVRYEPKSEDATPANNQVNLTVEAVGPARVLLVDPNPADVRDLARALEAQKFRVALDGPGALEAGSAALSKYASIVLSDMGRSELPLSRQEALRRYVSQGGSLLFAGGARSYGAGGLEGSVLEQMLPLKISGEEERSRASVAMALVIDRSGSMSGEPLEMAKAACMATLSVLDPADLIEVIAFDAKPVRAAPLQSAGREAKLSSELSRLVSGGGTEIFPALDMAYKDLLAAKAKKKHIVLLTDGNADAEGLAELATAAFADGITLTSVGFGSSPNETLMRSLADLGGGRYHAVKDARLLPRIFTRETELTLAEEQGPDALAIVELADAPFLRGIPFAAAPPLRGRSRLRLGPAPAQAWLGLSDGSPLLASTRVGLGTALAWAADFKSNYARELLRWPYLGKFLAQLLRAQQRSDDTASWPLELSLDGDVLTASFDAFDGGSNFDSEVRSLLELNKAEPSAPVRHVPFELVGPGHYQATARLDGLGVFLLKAQHSSADGALLGRSTASVARPYAEEYAHPELSAPAPGWLALPTVSRDQALARLLKRDRKVKEPWPLDPLLLALAAALLLADLVVRRWSVHRGLAQGSAGGARSRSSRPG